MPVENLRVLRLPQVRAKVGLGIDSIYRGAREGWFPKPVKLGARATGWFEHELDAYLASRPRGSGIAAVQSPELSGKAASSRPDRPHQPATKTRHAASIVVTGSTVSKVDTDSDTHSDDGLAQGTGGKRVKEPAQSRSAQLTRLIAEGQKALALK